MNEYKKQKQLLDSGFLTPLGEDRFTPKLIAFNALEEVLLKYGELFVKGFSEELEAKDANATGGLTDSMRYEYKKNGKDYKVSVYMADYASYVDEGVQGVNSSKSINKTSPYKFKFINPSKAHIAALENWIKKKNVVAIITVPKGITADIKPKSLAQAIGRSIKQRGLKATSFKKTVIDRLIDDFKAEVALAAGDDMKINILSVGGTII